MTAPTPRAAAPTRRTAGARRARFGLMTAVLVGAATVSVAIIGLLASRYAIRWDVTATQEQALSPRTQRLLRDLDGRYEIVVAADLGPLDRQARDRVGDVLDQFARVAPELAVTILDTASASGAARFQALLARLRERDDPKISSQVDAVTGALTGAEDLSAALERLSAPLLAVRDAIPEEAPGAEQNRTYFQHRAAEARVSADGLGKLCAQARAALSQTDSRLAIPPVDDAAAPVRQALVDLEPGLRKFAEELRQFSEAEAMPPGARDRAGPLAREIGRLRDRAAVLAEALRLQPLDIARVARVLQASEAALVIGPPDAGVTAIPFEWLFPASDVLDTVTGARADLRRKSEELFAGAIESLARPVNPVVVVVHGAPMRGFARSEQYRALVQRLTLRGMDVTEWPAVLDADPPSLTSLDPGGVRPIVFVVLNTDSTSGGSAPGQSGPERAAALGRAIRRLTEDGHNILLSAAPSVLPTYGESDPTIAMLSEFGLQAETGRPLLRELLTPQGRAVAADQVLLAVQGSTPIHGAVRGLRTLLEWPIPVRPVEGWTDGQIHPLFRVDDDATWAESHWLTLWQALQSGRGGPPSLPAPDSARDDTKGPWLVAVAATRRFQATGRERRLVFVGSNTWFQDRVTAEQAQRVDGRVAASYPGNVELFESAVYWLADQDERIGQSATARAIPVIRDLSPGTLTMLRWLVLAGLPLATLSLGVLWRVVRG